MRGERELDMMEWVWRKRSAAETTETHCENEWRFSGWSSTLGKGNNKSSLSLHLFIITAYMLQAAKNASISSETYFHLSSWISPPYFWCTLINLSKCSSEEAAHSPAVTVKYPSKTWSWPFGHWHVIPEELALSLSIHVGNQGCGSINWPITLSPISSRRRPVICRFTLMTV